jgi:predicted ATPase
VHHIAKVAIEGFWETHSIDLRLFPEVTFLIGPNGTGKTTLINLLAAALTADFRTLDQIPFKKMTIHLTPADDPEAPRITVGKVKRADRPFEFIEYRLKQGGKGAPETKYSLEDIEEQVLVRRYAGDPRRLREYYFRTSSGLLKELQKLVQVNWLSVHRTPSIEQPSGDRSFDSSVDQRLETLSNGLVRYLSELSKQKDNEVQSFQESVFVSLVEQQASVDMFDTTSLTQIDEFHHALTSIFGELHVPKAHTQTLLSSFVERAETVKRDIASQGSERSGGMSVDDAIVLLNLRRIGNVVDRWKKLQERLAYVFSPRDKWQTIANELFQRKQMKLTASNELQFESRTGKLLTTAMLSSGEKQLLILLTETLLQRGQPAVFIADEPELSLHVLWQEKLIGSLRALNPAAQIIVATHSPDIVGPLSDRAIDMETLIP